MEAAAAAALLVPLQRRLRARHVPPKGAPTVYIRAPDVRATGG